MPGLECVWCVCAWQSRAPDVTVLENVPGPRVSQTVIMHQRTLKCLKSCLHVNDPCWWEWRSVWNSDLNRKKITCITAFWCQAVLWELSKIFALIKHSVINWKCADTVIFSYILCFSQDMIDILYSCINIIFIYQIWMLPPQMESPEFCSL